jgi:hypothetical protein
MTTNSDGPDLEDQDKSKQGLLKAFAERIKQVDGWKLVEDGLETAGNLPFVPKGLNVDLSPMVDAAEYLSHTVRYGQPAVQAGIEKEITDIANKLGQSSEEIDQMAKDESLTKTDSMMGEHADAQGKDRQALQNLIEQQDDERAALLNAQEVQKQEMLESLQKRGVDESRIQELLTQQQQVFRDQQMQQQNDFKEQQKQIEQKHEKELFHPER